MIAAFSRVEKQIIASLATIHNDGQLRRGAGESSLRAKMHRNFLLSGISHFFTLQSCARLAYFLG